MKDRTRRIEFIGAKLTHSHERLIQKQIERWIIEQRVIPFRTSDYSYLVSVEWEDSPAIWTCMIELRMGGQHWEGYEEGKTLQVALSKTLQKLRPLKGYGSMRERAEASEIYA